MAKVLTAKELLSKYNVLDSSKRDKHAHYEFQAFAYKIAHDLNDLENLKIYMRMAKNVERSLMERAYSYALDAQTEFKGRKFMWKLKELRLALREKLNEENFDYDFIRKETKPYRAKLATSLLNKKNQFNDVMCFKEIHPKNNKVLIINCVNFSIIEFLVKSGYKITILEPSREIKKKILERYESLDRKLFPKIISTDFSKNKFKEKSFDFIIFNESWLSFPIDSETKLLSLALELLRDNGRIQIFSKIGNEKEEWKKYKTTDCDLKYFIKINKKNNIEEKFKSLKLEIKEVSVLENEIHYLLGKENDYF